MDTHDQPGASLFGADAQETPAALAAALAPPAAPGHFDELRGAASAPADAGNGARKVTAHGLPVRAWPRFFENLGRDGFNDLDRRTVDLERQVRDNGVTYNVYADADGPQRPWSVDPPPWRRCCCSWPAVSSSPPMAAPAPVPCWAGRCRAGNCRSGRAGSRLPGRYVSGHLLTDPPPGKARLVGSDASHAWVSVYVPVNGGPGRWVDLDPTNDRASDEAYVTLAAGRDYSDVSPLRGVIHGGARHKLDVAVTVSRVENDAAAVATGSA